MQKNQKIENLKIKYNEGVQELNNLNETRDSLKIEMQKLKPERDSQLDEIRYEEIDKKYQSIRKQYIVTKNQADQKSTELLPIYDELKNIIKINSKTEGRIRDQAIVQKKSEIWEEMVVLFGQYRTLNRMLSRSGEHEIIKKRAIRQILGSQCSELPAELELPEKPTEHDLQMPQGGWSKLEKRNREKEDEKENRSKIKKEVSTAKAEGLNIQVG